MINNQKWSKTPSTHKIQKYLVNGNLRTRNKENKEKIINIWQIKFCHQQLNVPPKNSNLQTQDSPSTWYTQANFAKRFVSKISKCIANFSLTVSEGKWRVGGRDGRLEMGVGLSTYYYIGGYTSQLLVAQFGLDYQLTLSHCPRLPRITLKQACPNLKNCLTECEWLLLHQTYFHILFYSIINKQNFTQLS